MDRFNEKMTQIVAFNQGVRSLPALLEGQFLSELRGCISDPTDRKLSPVGIGLARVPQAVLIFHAELS